MGNSGDVKNQTKVDTSAYHEAKHVDRNYLASGILGFIGKVCAQTWLPLMGIVSQAYWSGQFSVEKYSPLLLSYLIAFSLVSLLQVVSKDKNTLFAGIIYKALIGSVFSCVGVLLLFLLEDMGSNGTFLVHLLSGSLIGSGGSIFALAWAAESSPCENKITSTTSVLITLVCCALFSLVFITNTGTGLLVASIIMTLISAGCLYYVAKQGTSMKSESTQKGLIFSYIRLSVSFGVFGFIFAMMIMQFAIAPHGTASPYTWAFGFMGILVALVLLATGRIIKKSWDPLFAYRLISITVLIAFFPFDPGSEFSLQFALSFSTLSLFCFLTIAPFVIRSVANILHISIPFTAGISLSGVFTGAILGYLIALGIELLDPQPNFLINVSAIISITLSIVGVTIFAARGSFVRSYKKQQSKIKANDLQNGFARETDDDSSLRQNATLLAQASGLTSRETDVLYILVKGHNLGRVQQELFISEGTAITHRRHIYQKLNVHSKSELIDKATTFSLDEEDED